jgi:hypothetical protein
VPTIRGRLVYPTLQSFVDWLFRRIDRANEEASDAINELVRICLLMAAHAPVDRIIPAQLVEPAPARVGGRLQLALDISRVRRGMIALIRDRNDQIVSRAVIEDLIDGHASAVITQNFAAVTKAQEFGHLVAAIRTYDGSVVTRCASC